MALVGVHGEGDIAEKKRVSYMLKELFAELPGPNHESDNPSAEIQTDTVHSTIARELHPPNKLAVSSVTETELQEHPQALSTEQLVRGATGHKAIGSSES